MHVFSNISMTNAYVIESKVLVDNTTMWCIVMNADHMNTRQTKNMHEIHTDLNIWYLNKNKVTTSLILYVIKAQTHHDITRQ